MAQTKTTDPVNEALQALTLGQPSESNGNVGFKATNLYYPTERIYGGQLSAQALIAAWQTTDQSMLPNSIHESFLTTGKLDAATHYEVTGLRDGRSFSTRRVDASQDGRLLFTANASFQKTGQTGVSYHDEAPTDMPDPGSLPGAQELMGAYTAKSPFAKYFVERSPFDFRPITPIMPTGREDGRQSDEAGDGRQLMWVRLRRSVEVPQGVHRALLALECDQLMIEPDLHRAGLSIMTPGIFYASSDHAMWFYEDIDMNDWHLYVQDSPVAGHGRGLSVTKVYRRDGALAAVTAQEATIRVPQQQ